MAAGRTLSPHAVPCDRLTDIFVTNQSQDLARLVKYAKEAYRQSGSKTVLILNL